MVVHLNCSLNYLKTIASIVEAPHPILLMFREKNRIMKSWLFLYSVVVVTLAFTLLMVCTAQDRRDIIQTVEYHRDSRTGLCYATYGLGMQNGTMTNVPCTPEVEKLLVK